MIKDKNIDTGAKHALMLVDLHTCGSVTTTNGTAVVDAWVAPWAGKVVNASIFVASATTTTYTVDICSGIATNSASILSAAATCTATVNWTLDATSLISTAAFTSGAILTLRNSGTMTKPSVSLAVRPLLASETFGY